MYRFVTTLLQNSQLTCLFISLSLGIWASACRQSGLLENEPVNIILDTDIGPDVDDAGTVALLHALADRQEARLMGMMCNTTSEWGAPCLDAINTYYGRPDIPVGTLKGNGSSGDDPNWEGETYNRYIAQRFPADLRSGKQAQDAVHLYRALLTKSPDHSVTIVSVGALTNLRNLLLSAADSISPLAGLDLITKKVKVLSLMAGSYPLGKKNDPNFSMDIKASMETIRKWPTPIVFSGVEIGQPIKTGVRLLADVSPRNPVREAYLLWDKHFFSLWDKTYHGGSIHPHDSYDQTAALFAVRGTQDYWTLSQPGINEVKPDGMNQWRPSEQGRHRYLIQRKPPSAMASIIDSLMTHSPDTSAR